MNNEERDDRSAERWLDAALERYSDAEPRPGFETRLLARVAAERESKTRRRPLWMWASIAAAAAVLVIVLTVGRFGHQTPASPIAKSHSMPTPSVTPAPNPVVTANATPPTRPERGVSAVVHRLRPVVVANSSEQPRKAQFPTPAPLNEQEQLALQYVQRTPRQEIETVLAQKQDFHDLFYKLAVSQEQEKSDR
jgi:hypothetical protein